MKWLTLPFRVVLAFTCFAVGTGIFLFGLVLGGVLCLTIIGIVPGLACMAGGSLYGTVFFGFGLRLMGIRFNHAVSDNKV